MSDKKMSFEEETKLINELKSKMAMAPEVNVRPYNDFDEMLYDMKQYVKTTGHKLAIKDDALRLRLGFIDPLDEEMWFVIGIKAMKDWKDAHTKEGEFVAQNSTLINQALKSEIGKEKLLAVINGE
jgi:hypothetical protein